METLTPFQQFQVWLRRAAMGQRVMAGVASLLVLATFAWLVAPAGGDTQDVAAWDSSSFDSTANQDVGVGGGSTDTSSTSAVTANEPVVGDGGSTGGAPAASTAGGGDPAATSTATAEGTACPPGTDAGATDEEVTLAITLINIAGAFGNGTLGVPSPEVQQEQWQIVADAINAGGGAGCRQLALDFYSVNPINASEAQQTCLQIAEAGPFMALDTGSLTQPGYSDCIPNRQIPMMAAFLTRDQLENYYPYYLAPNPILDDVIRTGVLAFDQQGLFGVDEGFEKLGVLFRTCRPAPMRVMRNTLGEIGIPSDKVVEFDLGCPPGGRNTPVELQHAAVTFKRAGVTHVTVADVGDVVTFTEHAAQQNFEPRYLIAETKVVGTQSGTQQPNPENFDGAIVVDGTRYGEENTPGATPDAGTKRCNEIFAAAGYPPVWEQEVGYGGVICSMLWNVEALLDNVPQVQRAAMAPIMQTLGHLQNSYPWGHVDYSATPPDAPWGKPLWRNAVYDASCRCFKVPDLKFNPAFR